MEYRILGRTGLKVGAIALGCEGFTDKTAEEVRADFDFAIRNGINFLDLYASNPTLRSNIGAALAGLDKFSWEGHCMYCGHCAPCSVGIDIAGVNKYYNLTLAQHEIPETVREHYRLLPHHASECIACGRCERNCPFGVDIIGHMRLAAAKFGY